MTDSVPARLSEKDVLQKVPQAAQATATSGIAAEISKWRASIVEAELEHARADIYGAELNVRRSYAEGEIARLESARLLSGRSNALRPILGADDLAAALRGAPLEVRREVIDTLAVVTLCPQPRGRRLRP